MAMGGEVEFDQLDLGVGVLLSVTTNIKVR